MTTLQLYSVTETGAMPIDAAQPIPSDGFIWLDCTPSDSAYWPNLVKQITGVTILDEHLQDAANKQHPSFFDSTSRYEMIVFRGLAMFPSEIESKSSQIQIRTRPSIFFLLPNMLLTIHPSESRTFSKMRDRLVNAIESGTRTPRAPEELMLRLLNEMVDRYMDLREPLTKRLEQAQFELLDPKKPFRDWPSLLSSRLELRKLEALCEEQYDALQEWYDERFDREISVCGGSALTDTRTVKTRDVMEHVKRVLNHTQRLESGIDSAVQLHFSSMAHRSSEIMRVLTVLTAIFMPLTLITGIFGMNFEFIPGLHTRNGFWWALAIMATIAGSMWLWFRSRRWVATRGSEFPPVSQSKVSTSRETESRSAIEKFRSGGGVGNQVSHD